LSDDLKRGAKQQDSFELPDPNELYFSSTVDPTAKIGEPWHALLQEVAQAPNVDPSPFIRAPPETRVMLGRRLGHFRILDRLGEGGMGIVYKAEDENLRRPVALKVLRPRYLEDAAQHQRLVREAQSAASFNHPNIAAIYEVGHADGMAFIAMEYVDGKPLRSLIRKKLPPEAEVLHYAIEIARGLARAHDAGIVHRDLKPENLLVDRDGHAKILDFGLAKPFQQIDPAHDVDLNGDVRESPFTTQDGQILGTPVYMSPEQADGRAVDSRSDIYSLGVVLHELLTGHLPPRGRPTALEPAGAAAMSLNDTLPNSHLREGLIRIVQHCLELEADRRYADGRVLLASLEQLGRHAQDELQFDALPLLRTRWRTVGVAVVVAVALGIFALVFRPFSRSASRLKSVALADTKPLEHRLTANSAENLIQDAAIAPDGSLVAYVDQTGLFLRRLKSSVPERIQFSEDVVPSAVSWFQDSESFLVSALGKGTARDSIWKVSRHGSAEKIDDAPSPTLLHFMPRISPDGKAYAWVGREGILWKALSGGPSHLVVPSTEGDDFKYVTWSPSGKRIAYVRIREAKKVQQPFIETVDLLGSPPRIVVQRQELISEGGEEALGWAPDGRLVYGVVESPPKEPGTTLWTLAVDPNTGVPKGEAGPRAFWRGPIEGQLTVSTKGTLAFLQCLGELAAYVAELGNNGQFSASPKRLTMIGRDQRPTDWSSDGRTVAFMADQNGAQQVFLQDVDSNDAARKLTNGPSWHTWPRFTRDGLILFWQLPPALNDEPAQPELMRLAQPDGAAEHVMEGGQAVRFKRNGRPPPRNVHFRCSRSGACVYSELIWNELRFMGFDPNSGQGRELMRIDAENTPFIVSWDLSPDGSRVALPMENGRLRILHLAARQVLEQDVRSKCRLQFATWLPDGNSLFVTTTCAGEKQFKLFLVELGGRAQLLYESANQWIGNPVAGPDGRHLAFALKPQKADVYLLDGF